MKAYHWLALTSLFSTLSFAQDISILGDFQQDIHVQHNVSRPQLSPPEGRESSVTLMRVSLSEKAKARFLSRLKETTSGTLAKLSGLPPSVQLGMENVPVLNQGLHGSCVMFAVTAAMDAVIKKGDYVKNEIYKQHKCEEYLLSSDYKNLLAHTQLYLRCAPLHLLVREEIQRW